MESIVKIQTESEDHNFKVEYETLVYTDNDPEKQKIFDEIEAIDERINSNINKSNTLNNEIDRLTNHSDYLDYTIAVASGVIAGIIDSLWVGEFSLDRANKWGNDKVNNFVVKTAQKQGYKGEDLPGAIEYLEKKFPIVADKATNDFGGGLQHHLRDFSHHPTLVGLLFSLLTQFTGNVYGTDTAGIFKIVPVDTSELIGKNLPEKITFGVINWFFHIVSDMAGSSTSTKKGNFGTGIPGPLVSFLKEISALPVFRKMDKDGNKEFSVWISKLFNGTLLGKKDESGKVTEAVKFDLRTEIGVVHEIGRQALPVVINECIVRGFYFIRRLFVEIKTNNIESVSDLKNIKWKNTLPFKNRTIIRMLTISTGTMEAIDIADAAIRGAEKSGGNLAVFASNFVLRINFVGICRFAIAVGTDAGMGINQANLRNKRLRLFNETLQLYEAKLSYQQANCWIAVKDTEEAMQELYETANRSVIIYFESLQQMKKDMDSILETIPKIEDEEKNIGLTDEILDVLKWG